ncbi:MAG: TIGR03000 domain-containing protein [Planctomycetes bacterium]|nr:TIGR03000 domain-containing protein [Planctomycetota bacterium]
MSRALLASVALMAAVSTATADPPRVKSLQTQRVGNVTYFHAVIEAPADLDVQTISHDLLQEPDEWLRRRLANLPRLTSSEGGLREIYFHLPPFVSPTSATIKVILPEPTARVTFDGAITYSAGTTRYYHTPDLTPGYYYRYEVIATLSKSGKEERKQRIIHLKPGEETTVDFTQAAPEPRQAPAVPRQAEDLEFFGRFAGNPPREFVLHYPKAYGKDWFNTKDLFAGKAVEWTTSTQAKVQLDFKKATEVPRLEGGAAALETAWARAKARRLAVLELLTPEFGYYSLARELTARKYDVFAAPFKKPASTAATRHRLYDMTTGAAAITESLARERMLKGRPEPRSNRVVAVSTLPGINVAEHPWKKMMAGKTPAPEPLADCIPHDHYYLTFHNLDVFYAFTDLLDQWGGDIMRAVQVQSRDYQVRPRYEEQLCLPDGKFLRKALPKDLLKQLTGNLIRDIAITGSDLAFKEGTDVSVIFHVKDKKMLLTMFEPLIDAARAKHGKRLAEETTKHNGVQVASFTTPYREVSLHRAAVGDILIYANSRVALERILDTIAGDRPALSNSLDFQYMRTVFRRDVKEEDGFAFLSDAFIRNFVGPAAKIKAKRRYEALTSLHVATHGALYAAAETGRLPENTAELRTASGLSADELEVPEGLPVRWDGERQMAVSPVYNTIHFATPLIELPIDKVTIGERNDYAEFRAEYLRLWRRFFDPMGFRLKMTDTKVQFEAYILPLIESSQYTALRQITGGDGVKLDLGRLAPETLAQMFLNVDTRGDSEIGNWFAIRLDDNALIRQRMELRILRDLEPARSKAAEDTLFWQLPLTFGFSVRDKPRVFDEVERFWDRTELAGGKRTTEAYRGTDIKSVPIKKDYFVSVVRFLKTIGQRDDFLTSLFSFLPGDEAPPKLHYAFVGDAFYVSVQQSAIRRLVDLEKS